MYGDTKHEIVGRWMLDVFKSHLIGDKSKHMREYHDGISATNWGYLWAYPTWHSMTYWV